MDLVTVRSVRTPARRDQIALAPGERPLGGGTWLFSEEQPGLTGLVDLTTLGWPDLEHGTSSLTIGATCTIAALTRAEPRPDWRAWPLVEQCANALLASFKVWNAATVGGNVGVALPAGAMTALLVTLDAVALVWTPDGGERVVPVDRLVTGVRTLDLADGEVIRSFAVPYTALRGRTGFRRTALSPHGRSGALVTSRLDEHGFVLVVTAATPRPLVLRWDRVPDDAEVVAAMEAHGDWYDDPHGSPAWRRAVSTRFARELRAAAATQRAGSTEATA
ncbi:FAD-binding molybdopterin dehydrogenase [Curtobacterium sp. 'Ferrero']|uniref:FAD binding domain-containing protein n=1 Tax=Curtobacterium sp. 'Ferrero' TaxID=2033654 RepID=UPI000BC6BF9C|nr:FAD binding domain-containing protein [Curtobacterium sp. 'Ferrero']PCN47801.1 FAD-binding molybdopterin dehydrogenase [Curtobacterium sp. 'Ferrero']